MPPPGEEGKSLESGGHGLAADPTGSNGGDTGVQLGAAVLLVCTKKIVHELVLDERYDPFGTSQFLYCVGFFLAF